LFRNGTRRGWGSLRSFCANFLAELRDRRELCKLPLYFQQLAMQRIILFTMDLAESDEFLPKLTLVPKEKDYRRRNGEDEAKT
jgi:hypothetical protein